MLYQSYFKFSPQPCKAEIIFPVAHEATEAQPAQINCPMPWMWVNISRSRIKIPIFLISELLSLSLSPAPILQVLIPSHKSSVLRDKLDVYGRRVKFHYIATRGLKVSPSSSKYRTPITTCLTINPIVHWQSEELYMCMHAHTHTHKHTHTHTHTHTCFCYSKRRKN